MFKYHRNLFFILNSLTVSQLKLSYSRNFKKLKYDIENTIVILVMTFKTLDIQYF